MRYEVKRLLISSLEENERFQLEIFPRNSVNRNENTLHSSPSGNWKLIIFYVTIVIFSADHTFTQQEYETNQRISFRSIWVPRYFRFRKYAAERWCNLFQQFNEYLEFMNLTRWIFSMMKLKKSSFISWKFQLILYFLKFSTSLLPSQL